MFMLELSQDWHTMCAILVYHDRIHTASSPLLEKTAHMEIRLAPEYNHTLFSRLHSAAAHAGALV
jgi:hypothetical protein